MSAIKKTLEELCAIVYQSSIFGNKIFTGRLGFRLVYLGSLFWI